MAEASRPLPAAPAAARLGRLREGVWLPLAVVLALIVFFSFGSEAFFTLRNMTGITGQASTLLMVLLVGSVTVLAINFFGLGPEAVLVAVVFGTLLGLFNGLIYTFGFIPSFVVTLGSLSAFTGLAWQLL
jgi:ribose/xylose/arabinose/galactoside ABC-type transport system permease subunit